MAATFALVPGRMKPAVQGGVNVPHKLDEADRQSLLQLQRYPGIDGGLAFDLVRCGVRSAGQLGHEDPARLFRSLKDIRGRVDPDVLDTLAAAVHAARTGHADAAWLR